MRTTLPGTVGALALLVTLTGCGGGSEAPDASAPKTTGTSSSTESSSPSPTPSPSTPTALPDPCLLSLADLNDTLAGTWSKGGGDETFCLYRSARGGAFAITNVQEPDAERGIQDALDACDTTPRTVAATHSFACVERGDDSDTISGNIVVRGEAFLLTIVAGKGGTHEPELKAMTALLSALPDA